MTRFFRITRRTHQFVWLRWEAYGHERRGLSVRVSVDDFRRDWFPASRERGNGTQLYFRKGADLI